jgi:hypothetical protein
LAWHQRLDNPKQTFLVHGEEEVMQRFGQLLPDTQVEMPLLGQSYVL